MAKAAQPKSAGGPVSIQLLGAVRVTRGGSEVSMPQSKKTRALLAYLAVTKRRHRRERLCDMLWDVADDPRGALRWSLSKLRKVVDDGEERRIDADREAVSFVRGTAFLDVEEIKDATARGLTKANDEELERLAGYCRGEFLEGLELSDFMDFQSWCVGERESIRQAQAAIFEELVKRHQGACSEALPHAQSWVQLEPLSCKARISLLELLWKSGRRRQAEHHYTSGLQLFTELGVGGNADLEQAWRELQHTAPLPSEQAAMATPAPIPKVANSAPQREPAGEDSAPASSAIFVGRSDEIAKLNRDLEDARERRSERIVVMTGGPGQGKSCLAQELMDSCERQGGVVWRGKAFEAEGNRPYGPWADALHSLPADFLANNELPELGMLLRESRDSSDSWQASRERLFTGVVDLLQRCHQQYGSVLIVLDDLQWLDRDSAELLHYIARLSRQRPLMFLLLARGGELADNSATLKVLRSLRRDFDAQDLHLGKMKFEEIEALLREHSLETSTEHTKRILSASAGNPLYALELARSQGDGQDGGASTLEELVRERIDALPGSAPELLRWAAVLGHVFDLELLETLSTQGIEELVEAIELLERHEILLVESGSAGRRYMFSHDVVRESVYSELSFPRRRLMHRRAAETLANDNPTEMQAIQIAHHASMAGDAVMAVDACIRAGRFHLRMYANAEAENLARRGLHHAQSLPERERTVASIHLIQVQHGAGQEMTADAVAKLQALTERALDFVETDAASLGFHVLAYLRWEVGDVSAAHAKMMEAERVTRSATGAKRAVALAEAARCLIMVEKDLGQAEAFTLEAQAIIRRTHPDASVPRADGMLRAHRGDPEGARVSFEESRVLAQQKGNRQSEFWAIEEQTMLDIDSRNYQRASSNAAAMRLIAERFREGSEGPSARAMAALARWAGGDDNSTEELEEAMERLRIADSKFHLSFILTREARIRFERGEVELAKARALAGLDAARAVERPSEQALAHLCLLGVARDRKDPEAETAAVDALEELVKAELSSRARKEVEQALATAPERG